MRLRFATPLATSWRWTRSSRSVSTSFRADVAGTLAAARSRSGQSTSARTLASSEPGCSAAFQPRGSLAVEADPGNAAIHRLTIEANGLGERWRLVEAFAGTRAGTTRFVPASSGSLARADDEEGIVVPCGRRDARSPHADLVKIDIEGAEWPILADPRFHEFRHWRSRSNTTPGVALWTTHGRWPNRRCTPLATTRPDWTKSRLSEPAFSGGWRAGQRARPSHDASPR